MRNAVLSLVTLSLFLAACQRRSQPEAPQPPAGGGDQIVIAPGGGLGGTQITTGGRAMWPPQGPNCERFVACCQQASSAMSDIALMCQMSVATTPVDCLRALGEVRQYLTERQAPVPPVCAGGPTPPTPPAPPPTPTPPAPPQPSPSPPVTCASDADCPRLACGPCQSGDVVTRFFTSINCMRNPCPGSTAVCRSGVCVVR